jgi:transposase
MDDATALRAKFRALMPWFDEATLRVWAAVEARSLGRGGVSAVARATGLSRTTIHAGLAQLEAKGTKKAAVQRPRGRVRSPGGGRKKLTLKDPALLRDLEALVEPLTRGDPQSPLRWTCKSTTRLAAELNRKTQRVSQRSVCDLLSELDYSLQSTRKTREGAQHPDRDAQFAHIAKRVAQFQAAGQPVISVDTKKKELIGDFANAGREWHPKGQPEAVRVHDFADQGLGKVVPYGVYDLAANAGWVSVGIDHDTAEFAVESIRRWWREMGAPLYPRARRLLITADCGGSNGHRLRLWKVELQKLANESRLDLHVSHFPPGTSKWNKIEHRMFCHITQNWRGRPLQSRQVVVKLIGKTTTTQGLRIKARLDTRHYASGIKVTDEQLAAVKLKPDPFHGEWNYAVVHRK